MNIILYSVAFILLLISFFKDRKKTKMALLKAVKSLSNILPQLLCIILIMGMVLAFLEPEMISKIIGSESGFIGLGLAMIVGSITLIPGFVAFPLSKTLLDNGAGYVQIAGFVSSLMMVGIVTLSLEIKFFSKKSAILRNGLAFIFSFIVAIIIGKVMG